MDDTQLFLLRVWLHRNQFRASVRGVSEEQPRLFTEPGQVTEFLVALLAAQTRCTGLLINPGE